jgi:hypothetical protein
MAHLVALSDSGLNGQPERISATVRSGSYFAEIRSFYTDGQTNKGVFNSGRYRLTLTETSAFSAQTTSRNASSRGMQGS